MDQLEFLEPKVAGEVKIFFDKDLVTSGNGGGAMTNILTSIISSREISNIMEYAMRFQDLTQSIRAQAIDSSDVEIERKKLENEITLNEELSSLAKALLIDRLWTL